MKRTVMVGAILGLSVLSSLSALSEQITLNNSDGLRVVRLAMSVQANKPFGKGAYGSGEEIVRAANLTTARVLSEDVAELEGYVLRVSRSENKNSYQISLTPMTGCGTAWFSSEANVIYSGQALGCK